MKQKATAARLRLRQAVDRACITRGEAHWTNGYRAGFSRVPPADEYGTFEEDRLYRKEQAQFEACAKAEATVDRAMRAYASAIRKASR